MTGVLLALGAALGYGLSDFTGGAASRRTSPWAVAVVSSLTGSLLVAVVSIVLPGQPTHADLYWGALAGIGNGLGGAFLYRGFSAGRMAVVAPVSAVGAAVVPLVAGVVGGERPSMLVWLGIAFALPGIWLVSREVGHSGRVHLADGLADGLLAGGGFGLLFAAMGQVPDTAGFWPLALSQAVGLVCVVVVATLLGGSWVPREPAARWGVLTGSLSVLAVLAFLLAAQQGLLAVAAVLTSLYPATTVLLAALLLHERVHRTQGLGLLLCGVTVVCAALG